jgi:tetratricopeptide (TPR) repeat protein
MPRTSPARAGHYRKYTIELNPLAKLNVTLAEAYGRRGYYYFYCDENDKAIADYTRAMELDPLDVYWLERLLDVYWEVGIVHLERHEYDGAIAYYTKAVELDRGNNEYFRN